MKKIGDLMEQMGFQKDSSEESKRAFIKYLLRVASKNYRPLLDIENVENDEWFELRLQDQKAVDKVMDNSQPVQLSFVFDNETDTKTG